jgi:hypothetical protein
MQSRSSATVGLGVEWAFAGNWSARAEWDAILLQNQSFTVSGSAFGTDTITVNNRSINMFTAALNYIAGHGADDTGGVLPPGACQDAPFTVAGLGKLIERVGVAAGIGFKVHPHVLRHAAGFVLANKGTDTCTLQARTLATPHPIDRALHRARARSL